MEKQKYLSGWGSIAIVLSPALVIFSSLPVGLRAQPYPEWKVSLEFPEEQNVGQPASTVGAATRTSCSEDNKEGKMPLTGLMPRNPLTNRPVNQTLTVAANPTFFVYVPETTAKSAEFWLFDDQDNKVYETSLQLPTVVSSDVSSSSVSTPGIVKLSLPANVSLETGKTYHWEFQLNCPPEDPKDPDASGNPLVGGWIQRTELSSDLKTKIEQATPLEQAKLYAKARIWSEALMLAAQLRSSHPAEWEELLKSVGLNEIAQVPLLECCTLEN
jgi:hypothetical protein